MKCGPSQKLFAPTCRLSSRSFNPASANGCPSVSTSLKCRNSSAAVARASSPCCPGENTGPRNASHIPIAASTADPTSCTMRHVVHRRRATKR